ncbi:MAG: LVIVD repeat-containing protein [Armatimonadota bacterium]
MKTRLQRAIVVAAALVSLSALVAPGPGSAHSTDGEREKCPCCMPPKQLAKKVRRLPKKRAQREKLRIAELGHVSMVGYTADVWAHNGFAYVGSSSQGVAIVDIRNPSRAKTIGRVARIPGTSAEDLEVRRIETPYFTGDLLVVGIQCPYGTAGERGMEIWDVTDPFQPRHLAFWRSDVRRSDQARGVHELYLFSQGDRAFVGAMTPESEEAGSYGDFRIVEVTNPREPVQIADWGAFKDGKFKDSSRHFPWGHSATVNEAGNTAVISFWDAGTVFLDLTDPARPRMKHHILRPSGPEGNTHSTNLSPDDSLMLVTDENLSPLKGKFPWGFLRVWDISDVDNPRKLSEYATKNSRNKRGPGLYSIHNTVLKDNLVYMSWFSDGIRVLDLADREHPRALAAFKPKNALFWGVFVTEDGLILGSDINRGLYILRLDP